MVPVSYTHLDVYKRQAMMSANMAATASPRCFAFVIGILLLLSEQYAQLFAHFDLSSHHQNITQSSSR